MIALSDGVDLGDYGLRLPSNRATPGSAVPLGLHDPGAVVRSSTIDWEARARVASEAAYQLGELIATLTSALPNNYFGDCAEGRQMFSRATSAIDSWNRTLKLQRDSLLQLAAGCRDASSRIGKADGDGASGIQI